MAKHGKYLVAGNWKMNISSSDVGRLIAEINAKIANITKVDVLICPPFTSIQAAKDAIGSTSNIFLGAQNFYPEKNGPYTGEVSAIMLRELGVSHVIIGHSERRIYFNEDDDFINRKVKFAFGNSLIPILCIGETIEQRRDGKEFNIIQSQLKDGLKDITPKEAEKLTIAYEPVWAIGTGETATPEIAQEMHAFIRNFLKEMFNAKVASTVKILYGGSMKADNAEELLEENDIDGGLIGGASLKATSFCEIVKIANLLSA
ncbi:MAG: triose-phosphate isomerase [Puniceicoccales bacterium]|jgi:triosephosphate isomerase|nr:triose-phosphate isomerase [Puniceicoccales bacterium]